MLTKDLLTFKRRGNYIKPGFIVTENSTLNTLAAQLVTIYTEAESEQLSRGALEEIATPVIKAHRDLKLAKGLNKLLLDRCLFSRPGDYPYSEMRHNVFLQGAQLLRNNPSDLDDYRNAILSDAEVGIFASEDIFADLPENETLTKFKAVFAQELLQRYNLAQVQGLLIYADQLEVKVASDSAADLRRLFKYLKFFRLLATIRLSKQAGFSHAVRLQISGPANQLEASRKYGLQLAMFFPAICALPQWSVSAEVNMSQKRSRLTLNQESKLIAPYKNFSAYIPEEIVMFHRLFKEKIDDWEVVGNAPFFKDKRELFFPDLSFKHHSGKVIHLELFHRWHRHELLKRLAYCEQKPKTELLIGVDRALLDKELQGVLDGSEFFAKHGFLFRDFPGVDRVHKLLKKNLD